MGEACLATAIRLSFRGQGAASPVLHSTFHPLSAQYGQAREKQIPVSNDELAGGVNDRRIRWHLDVFASAECL